jgi:hypothetical protein
MLSPIHAGDDAAELVLTIVGQGVAADR